MSGFGDLTNDTSGRTGDWTCSCGQAYRVLASDGDVRMWPKNSAGGYRCEPIDVHCLCGEPVARGTVLSALFGAAVPAPALASGSTSG